MRRAAGMLMFTVGVMLASCYAARAVHPSGTGPGGVVTARDRVSAWSHAAGWPFAAGMLLLIVGGLLSRGRRRDIAEEPAPQGSEHEGFAAVVPADQQVEEPHPPPLAGEVARPEVILMRMAARLDKVPVEDAQRDAEVIQGALDDVLESDVNEFLGQREDLVERLGLARFAEMMGHFAVMERNASRAWSAITDESFQEVRPCIERARAGLAKARHTLDPTS